jgi:N-carbamoyl-L-amino-acid hydrolase
VKISHIDIARLQKEIDDLALISENPPPVVTRVLFSAADLRARQFVKTSCREAGLILREDELGNTFARWEGMEPQAPAVATGSHIDAIPNAGKYDGVVGVLGAIEAIRALRRDGFRPQKSIELIVFTAEEPTRFGIGCLGSRWMAGTLPPAKLAGLRDRDGNDLEFWRSRAGLKAANARSQYAAFVELHIEQGPILEQRGLAIGVVEKIAAPSSLRATLEGVGGHAGAVLMPERRDALLAGAEIALAVEKTALESVSPDMVATTGVFQIEPGAVNSVPCRAMLEIDLRDTQLTARDAALRQIESAAAEICRRRRIGLELQIINADPPAACANDLVDVVAEVCRDLQLSFTRMISRAYHDSLFMALLTPTTMIFIPCRGGVSHRPDEYSSPAQIQNGVAVLAETLRRLAG